MNDNQRSMKHHTPLEPYLTLARARRGRKGPRCWRPDMAGVACFEEPEAVANRQAWERRHPGLQRVADGYQCLGAMLKGHRRGCRRNYAPHHADGTPCFLEGGDHEAMWLADGRVACCTSQPYHIDAEMEKRLATLAENHGFHIVIRDPKESFWFVGSTWVIEIWRDRETCEAARIANMTV